MSGFARMIERAGEFDFKPHPHMLRHACGFVLANKGHDTRALQAYVGHRNIQHTVRYTELSPGRFKDFCAPDESRRPNSKLTSSATAAARRADANG